MFSVCSGERTFLGPAYAIIIGHFKIISYLVAGFYAQFFQIPEIKKSACVWLRSAFTGLIIFQVSLIAGRTNLVIKG
jgi:hypothetical protein